jgi:hypothetical protein
LLVLAVIAPAQAQTKPTGGTLRGRVEEQNTGAPITSALVEFMDGRTRIRSKTTTDANGQFVLSGLPQGSFRLRVTRIGYAHTTTPYWRVQSGEVLSVVVRVLPDAVPLAPLEISTRFRSAPSALEGFHARQRSGLGGTFITRDDIRKQNPALITDLLATVPGVYLENAPALGRTARIVTFGPRVGPGGGSCPVQVFIDGVLASRAGPVSVDELATPAGLMGIEIHSGLSSLPAELVTANARCGVIALWTERGG